MHYTNNYNKQQSCILRKKCGNKNLNKINVYSLIPREGNDTQKWDWKEEEKKETRKFEEMGSLEWCSGWWWAGGTEGKKRPTMKPGQTRDPWEKKRELHWRSLNYSRRLIQVPDYESARLTPWTFKVVSSWSKSSSPDHSMWGGVPRWQIFFKEVPRILTILISSPLYSPLCTIARHLLILDWGNTC
jgi:hypothetical protein